MTEFTREVDCMAFADTTCVASGALPQVARLAVEFVETHPNATVLLLDGRTSEVIDIDWRGTADEVAARLAPAPSVAADSPDDAATTAQVEARLPGRPKLGVVAREVTLLPRHWEWLNEQPGGASVTLRKLVEEARRSTAGEARVRKAREACYRFMSILAGDEPGYEEALRALYAGDRARFELLTEQWPVDVRGHARRLAAPGFTE
jgi:hypothetical protein